MNEAIREAVQHRPLQQIHSEPWAFMLLALALGFGVGFLVRFPKLRKGLEVVSLARGMAGTAKERR